MAIFCCRCGARLWDGVVVSARESVRKNESLITSCSDCHTEQYVVYCGAFLTPPIDANEMPNKKQNQSWCFITTATCDSFGKADDCHELTVLRKFRDEFMLTDENMKAEVAEYYRIAPKICYAINRKSNKTEIYKEIWEKWLDSAVRAVDSGENEKAHAIYKDMVLTLKNDYLNTL